MKWVLISLINLYQKIPFSSHKQCRFIPTCSAYAIEAIETHGAFKGFFLSLWRVIRCNPLCKGGYDPVPPKKTANKKR